MISQDLPERIYLIEDEFSVIRWSYEKSPFGESDDDSLEYIKAETVHEILKDQRRSCLIDAIHASECDISNAVTAAILNAKTLWDMNSKNENC